jgi:hypothetical protein
MVQYLGSWSHPATATPKARWPDPPGNLVEQATPIDARCNEARKPQYGRGMKGWNIERLLFVTGRHTPTCMLIMLLGLSSCVTLGLWHLMWILDMDMDMDLGMVDGYGWICVKWTVVALWHADGESCISHDTRVSAPIMGRTSGGDFC